MPEYKLKNMLYYERHNLKFQKKCLNTNCKETFSTLKCNQLFCDECEEQRQEMKQNGKGRKNKDKV